MADGAPQGLQDLPPEVMLMILEDLPDLSSLGAIVLASNWTRAVFRDFSIRLINPLLDQMPGHLRRYPLWIAIVASLQSPNSPYRPNNPGSIRSFIDKCTAVHGLAGLGQIIAGGNGFPRPNRELQETPGPLEVVIAAHKVESLTPVCLSRPMTLLSELEEGHPPAPVHTYIDANGSAQQIRMPEDESFLRVGDPEPPSYVERTRVEEALWQLLTNSYARHLPQMPRHGPSRENIDKWYHLFDADELDITDLVAGGWNRYYFRGDPFDCVQDTLRELIDAPVAKFLAHDRSANQENKARTRLRRARRVPPLADPWGSVKDPPLQTGWERTLGRSRVWARKPNYGMAYYQDRFCNVRGAGPGTRHDFRALSRLGASIWDTSRLIRHGLAFHPGEPPFVIGNYAHWSWRSILIQEVSRIANKSASRGRMNPDLVRWAKAWMRPGAMHTRSTARDFDIHDDIDTRSYDAGPYRTPEEGDNLAGRGFNALTEMGGDLDSYYAASPTPDGHPAVISDEEDDL